MTDFRELLKDELLHSNKFRGRMPTDRRSRREFYETLERMEERYSPSRVPTSVRDTDNNGNEIEFLRQGPGVYSGR